MTFTSEGILVLCFVVDFAEWLEVMYLICEISQGYCLVLGFHVYVCIAESKKNKNFTCFNMDI